MDVTPSQISDGPLMLLSPHADDAALSCAALLARPEPIDILTVFSGQPDPPRQGEWDRLTGFASSADSVPARLEEERAALAGTPHRLTLLDLLDLQYVGEPRPAVDARAIAEAIRSWLDAAGGAVALPAGAGWRPGRLRRMLERYWQGPFPSFHPDHDFVRDAALSVAALRPEAPLLLYEELPYRFGGRADPEVKRLAAELGRTAELLVAQVDRAAKAARIAAYGRQVPHFMDDGTRLDDPASLPGEERYWRLAPGGTDASDARAELAPSADQPGQQPP
jgi:LmbE family N-acetylglucosaminyl deacetylase